MNDMMTLEQQRIAIAEWMGWTLIKVAASHAPMGYADNLSGELRIIPDYTNDLNAIHEAEKKLDKSLSAKYQESLVKICVTLDKLFVVGQKYGLDGYVIHASAAQRSEALCRTLWPERWAV